MPVKCVDDSLLLGQTFEICFKNIRTTVALLREPRFTIHPEKSVLVPAQQIIFLAFVTDCKNDNNSKERKESIYTL